VTALGTQFSEQQVQAELERIVAEHIQRNQYDAAAAQCEQLAADYPESKWLGNILLLAASCYKELCRADDEMRILERFMTACPQHSQAASVGRALERLQAHNRAQADAGEQSAALALLQQRVRSLATALHSKLDHLSGAVAGMSERVENLDSRTSAICPNATSDGSQPTIIELMDAMVQDTRAEVEARWQKMEDRLRQIDRAIARVTNRRMDPRSTKNMAAAALVGSLLSLAVGVALYDDIQGGAFPAAPRHVRVAASTRSTGLAKRPPARVRAAPRVVITATTPPKPRLQTAQRVPSTKQQVAAPVAASAAPRSPAAARPVEQHPPQAAPRRAEPAFRTYTVKPGETLWSIAKSATGSGKAVEKIAALNGLSPPYNVRSGQKIRLPQ
jgi:nucleoid-associated protein YgaU